jgi:peptidoglycan/LPS O-acetylase OafA/YrhL
MRPTYRPDIDGLRAISAVAVVLFHSHVQGFGGGFVGVDVFFVISGYLITKVLLASSDRPALRWLSEFYIGRCRRVLPALFVLLLTVTPIAVLLIPTDRELYGRYLSSTSVLLTNLVAWTDHEHGWPALIHLWTIAVEEQFYLVYPLMLFAAQRVRCVSPALLLAILAAGSFTLSVWASYAAPGANYYLTPPRIWELLSGALLVLTRLKIRARIAAELLATVGLLTIALAVCLTSTTAHYPGLRALPVCMAAAALLATGQDQKTWVARLLSMPPLVFTGRMSYSLYLWHAAILSLFWSRHRAAPNASQTLLLLAAIWLLALLSWHIVERPIRTGTWLKSNRRFLIAAALFDLSLGGVGLLL